MDAEPWPDPDRLLSEVEAFEVEDRLAAPVTGAIVFAGSSSFAYWRPTLQADMRPLTIVPRGFGGSTMFDLDHYLDRLVLRHQPRAVVIYEGDNDIGSGVSPEAVLTVFRKVVNRIHALNPATRIYVVPVKPSPDRWPLWPTISRLNGLFQDICRSDARFHYIDTTAALLDQNGNPFPSLYLEDMLHMNRLGYERWLGIIKPLLQDREGGFEPSDRLHLKA